MRHKSDRLLVIVDRDDFYNLGYCVMNDNFDDTYRVSFRLADGQFHPLLRYGHADTDSLTLVPAGKAQKKVVLQFYYHFQGKPHPVYMGKLNFSGLSGIEPWELKLEASLAAANSLRISIVHENSGRSKKAVFKIAQNRKGSVSNLPETLIWRSKGLYWFLGFLFIVICLAVIAWGALSISRGKLILPQTKLISYPVLTGKNI